MTDLPNTGFADFNEAYAARTSVPMQPESVFLHEDVLLHGSGVAPSVWQWFDSPRQLAEYLLHIGLPDMAGWWLAGQLGGGPAVREPLRDTVDAATDGSPEDKSFFLALGDELESVLATGVAVDFKAVAAVADRFSARFGDTPAGRLCWHAFPDAVAAGTHLFDESDGIEDPEGGEDLSRDQWLSVCARAGSDPAASAIVTRVFDHALSV